LCSDLKRPQALIMSDPVDAEGVGGERGAAFATDFGARGEACLAGRAAASAVLGRGGRPMSRARAVMPVAEPVPECEPLWCDRAVGREGNRRAWPSGRRHRGEHARCASRVTIEVRPDP